MDAETKDFKENVDAWVKQIRGEIKDVSDMSSIVEESIGNIQHNYELIHELRDEIERLKEEVNAIKIIEIINLKKMNKKI